jgi:hypothetical protein
MTITLIFHRGLLIQVKKKDGPARYMGVTLHMWWRNGRPPDQPAFIDGRVIGYACARFIGPIVFSWNRPVKKGRPNEMEWRR